MTLVIEAFVPEANDCRLPQRRRLAPAPLPKTAVPLDSLLDTTSEPTRLKPVFDFRPEDFVGAVVTPTYRNVEQPPRYYVAKVQ